MPVARTLGGQVLFVTSFEPVAFGHGGNRRSYQIWHELTECVGRDGVVIVPWTSSDRAAYAPAMRDVGGVESRSEVNTHASRFVVAAIRALWRGRGSAQLNQLKNCRGSGQRKVSMAGLQWRGLRVDGLLEKYREALNVRRPLVSIIDHAGFADLVGINRRVGIRSIACVQNLESLDMALPFGQTAEHSLESAMSELLLELRKLSQFDVCLFGSRVECGFVGGLGFDARFHEYQPVGAIRAHLQVIRARRAMRVDRAGFVLMLGSVAHETTHHGFKWFLEHVESYGLPDDVTVIVAGHSAERLLEFARHPRVEVRGWLEQAELDELLVSCDGVVLPQFLGFGGITRLSEMALAGIPVVASLHPLMGVRKPPGVVAVGHSWDEWQTAILGLSGRAIPASWHDYLQWEADGCGALSTVVQEQLDLAA